MSKKNPRKKSAEGNAPNQTNRKGFSLPKVSERRHPEPVSAGSRVASLAELAAVCAVWVLAARVLFVGGTLLTTALVAVLYFVGALSMYVVRAALEAKRRYGRTDKDALLAEVVSFLLEEITPALEGLWFSEGRDARAVCRHLADVYARNGNALATLLAIRVGGDGDLHEQLYRTCCSVFTDWARGHMDDDVLLLAADVYASVVLTFIERSAQKPLTDKELTAIDRARELFIEGFGAR